MASERKTGAGGALSGVLERATPPRPVVESRPPSTSEIEPDVVDSTVDDQGDAEPAREPKATRGRGDVVRKTRTGGVKSAKVKGRTIYLPDDLFERIMVQAHRKDRTISEYVTAILEKQVPDYRSRDQGDAA